MTYEQHLERVLLSSENALPALISVLWKKGLMICRTPDEYSSDPFVDRWMLFYARRDYDRTFDHFCVKHACVLERKNSKDETVPELQEESPFDFGLLKLDSEQRKASLEKFSEECRPSEEAITNADLYDDYKEWSGERGYPIFSSATFFKKLRKLRPEREAKVERRSLGWLLETPRQRKQE